MPTPGMVLSSTQSLVLPQDQPNHQSHWKRLLPITSSLCQHCGRRQFRLNPNSFLLLHTHGEVTHPPKPQCNSLWRQNPILGIFLFFFFSCQKEAAAGNPQPGLHKRRQLFHLNGKFREYAGKQLGLKTLNKLQIILFEKNEPVLNSQSGSSVLTSKGAFPECREPLSRGRRALIPAGSLAGLSCQRGAGHLAVALTRAG